MLVRISQVRRRLREELETMGSTRKWNHITDQIGMFCYTGLSPDQVLKLRERYHIYCTDDGRFSMAGMNEKNVKYVAQAVHDCTRP
jgi:aspartate aminotransferase